MEEKARCSAYYALTCVLIVCMCSCASSSWCHELVCNRGYGNYWGNRARSFLLVSINTVVSWNNMSVSVLKFQSEPRVKVQELILS